MNRPLNISFQLENGEHTSIPILYSVTHEEGNENIKLISCKVDLSNAEIPEWLSPAEFIIRQVYTPGSYGGVGVTVTELSRIPCLNIDSANFVNQVHDRISILEKIS